MDPLSLIVIISLAVLIDLIFGELPAKIHPVVLIGKFIEIFKIFKENHSCLDNRLAGLILTIFLILLFSGCFIVIIWIFKFNNILLIVVLSVLLSTTFSIKLLLTTADTVKKDLYVDINQARKSVSYLVSRDTSVLSTDKIISAVIETLTENITDSVVSPIFYTYIFGIVGGILFRVVNTLDAMIGYKNPENINIGWFPARLDDVLNYIPARATGFLIVIAAFTLRLNWKNSYKIMVRDAKKTPSPNSGYPMAAAAGALNIQLTKPGNYQLGDPINQLKPEIISKTILLAKITILLFLSISILIFATITIIIF